MARRRARENRLNSPAPISTLPKPSPPKAGRRQNGARRRMMKRRDGGIDFLTSSFFCQRKKSVRFVFFTDSVTIRTTYLQIWRSATKREGDKKGLHSDENEVLSLSCHRRPGQIPEMPFSIFCLIRKIPSCIQPFSNVRFSPSEEYLKNANIQSCCKDDLHICIQ